MLAIFIFLTIELGLFARGLQVRLAGWFRKPGRIFLIPGLLICLFAAILGSAGAWSWTFLGLVAAYTLLPTCLVYRGGPYLEILAVLCLWLPVEFTAGKYLLPQRAWGAVNIGGHGAAVTLGLFLFLVYRGWKGMKYNLPESWRDLLYPAIGFLAVAPVLIFLGLRLGFLGPFHVRENAGFAFLFLKTLVGVAIPEELLFRALIQNWIMQNFGFSHRSLAAAAVIFGAAHLNNGVFPNWRYMILASIAGFVYGKVFWKSSTILSSAGLHAFVNALRHTLFL